MFSADDTIVAIATPPGRGGLGVVRLSGPAASSIACRLVGRRVFAPRHATLCHVHDESDAGGGPAVDEVVCTAFPAPHSYTGEDVVEISAHGSPVVLARIVAGAVQAGARLAAPGEFTLRAYLHGRMDLVQAEAVADLVDAVTPAQARLAFDQLQGTLTRAIGAAETALFELTARLEASLDFPEEGYEFVARDETRAALAAVARELAVLVSHSRSGRVIREGASVAVVGRPNVGKSSLFNRLVGFDRAIIAERPGTTRDLVTERVDILGVPVLLVDTAGMRHTAEGVEREGVERARGASNVADLSIVVVDGSRLMTDDDREVLAQTADRARVVVVNKNDLPGSLDAGRVDANALKVSAKTGAGIDELRRAIVERLGARALPAETAVITNIRHVTLVERAAAALDRAMAAVDAGASEEFVLADTREALDALQEVSGARASDAVLTEIFSRFCIGK